VSLYLKVAVGAGLYLLDAGQVIEIRAEGEKGRTWREQAVPILDCRDLLGAAAGISRRAVLCFTGSGDSVELVVDRVEGLIELADRELHPLPQLGPLGELIDAIVAIPGDDRLFLRLRAERMPTIAVGDGWP
jgi:chemotaxis signal transduction protein